MAINSVSISGNLVREPELRFTSSGSAVLSFTVAVNNRRKNPQTGEWEDDPCFVDCALFGKRAESVGRIVSKGAKVTVQGRLRQESWHAKDGSKRSKISVVVDDIEVTGKRQEQVPSYGQAYDYSEEVPF